MTIDDKVHHRRGNSVFLNWILNRASSSAIVLIIIKSMSSAIFKIQTCWAALLKLILICDATFTWKKTIGSHQNYISVHFQFPAEQSLIFTFSCLFGPSSHFENTSCFGYNKHHYFSNEKMSIPEITWLKCHSIMKYIKIFLLQWQRLASLQLRNSIISSLSKVRPRKHYPMKSHQMWYGLFVIAQYR